MLSKKELMQNLIIDLAEDSSIEKILVKRKGQEIDVGLVNQYKLNKLIPNKWFDWLDRVDSKVMLIGQDWGPYIALEKYIDSYNLEKDSSDFDYQDFLFKTFSSRTEKFILNSLTKTFKEKYSKDISKSDWNNFFFTIAVLYTRQGKHFRGSHNFDPKISLDHSYPYVSRQIDIVKPKIIMPLGGMAWEIISKKFDLKDNGKTITEVMNNLSKEQYLKVGDYYIIPNFHPASYVDPKIMVRQFSKIWELV